MQARSKVIERNSEQFEDHERLLIVSPPEKDNLSYLNPSKVITFDYRVFRSLEADLGGVLSFGFDSLDSANYDSAIIHIPKSKGELDLLLAFASSKLNEGADIYMVGEKKAGIASAAKKLDEYSDDLSKLDSAKHCQLWHGTLTKPSELFCFNDWMSHFEISLNNIDMKVASVPGVFSSGELDDATDLLLSNMFTRLEGRVLDFGCGSGVLGCYTKLLNPTIKLEMVDINYFALKCAEETARLNDLEVKIYPSDGWSDIQGRVNAVVTNPPFHQGVETEYTTTEGFIKTAKDKMAKHAPFLLVANSFLKYPSIIEATFGRCDILAETTKFRAYKAFR